jgi:hypothetical protein
MTQPSPAPTLTGGFLIRVLWPKPSLYPVLIRFRSQVLFDTILRQGVVLSKGVVIGGSALANSNPYFSSY